jgi:futalosine hydrolase
MKILLVAATGAEIGGFAAYLEQNWENPFPSVFKKDQHEIHICITGVGIMAATYATGRAVGKQEYDFALQAGVGGSFDRDIALGQLVLIESEQAGDLGAEDHENYLDIFELNLLNKDEFPFMGGKLVCPLHEIPFSIPLPTASSLTINTVSGREETIRLRSEKFNCQVESMEGAAFHYVCLQEKLPFAQVRAISNYVEPRDKSKWKMKEAIIALNKWLIDFSNKIAAS